MRVFRGFEAYEPLGCGSVAAVGSFDGVHRGHRWLIDRMNGQADRLGADAVVVTFEPHPREVLRGTNRLLSTLDEKLQLLEEAGARTVVVVDFTREFAARTGEEFFRNDLIQKLGLRTIFAGEGHHFGSDRRSGADLYEQYGVEWRLLERIDGISSTQIRDLIEQGRTAEAEALLGREYLIRRPVDNPFKLLPLSE